MHILIAFPSSISLSYGCDACEMLDADIEIFRFSATKSIEQKKQKLEKKTHNNEQKKKKK